MPDVLERRCLAVLVSGAAACVPEGPATTNEVTLPEQTIVVLSESPPIAAVFRDEFERDELGPDYLALSDAWGLSDGWLCVEGAMNRGVWLSRRLPANVRVEFDAMALSPEGDIKVELFGDGLSGATGATYDNATGYIAIFGGWNNTFHVLAKHNEHVDRQEIVIGSVDDPLAVPVQPGRRYHFKFERRHGNMLLWSVDGTLYFTKVEKQPLTGAGHEHFGFNDWTAPVCFDNLEIEPL